MVDVGRARDIAVISQWPVSAVASALPRLFGRVSESEYRARLGAH